MNISNYLLFRPVPRGNGQFHVEGVLLAAFQEETFDDSAFALQFTYHYEVCKFGRGDGNSEPISYKICENVPGHSKTRRLTERHRGYCTSSSQG